MRNRVPAIGLWMGLIALSACGSSPVAPAPVPVPVPIPVPACQTNSTATLILANQSVSLTPRDVYLDGVFLGTVPYGSTVTRDVSAGVPHPVVFRSTLTGLAVSNAQPNLIQCSSSTLTNTF